MCYSFIDKLKIIVSVSSHHGFNERHTIRTLPLSTLATSLGIKCVYEYFLKRAT